MLDNGKLYVTHTCKDETCGRGFMAEDKYKAMKPPKWRYCPECEAQGKYSKRPPPSPEKLEQVARMNAIRQARRESGC